jgi:hypothetical protein
MLTCLLEGIQTASHRAVNFDKLREIIQRPTENPADFLGHLTEALICYIKLDPSSKDGIIILNFHFLFPSSPDIKKKNFKQAEDDPQPPPRRSCVKMALKVFNNQDEPETSERPSSQQLP